MKTMILAFALVCSTFAAAAPGKYPLCAKGRALKVGDKFHLEFDFKDTVNGDLALVLYQMGVNTVLRPAFPRMITTGMSIAFELVSGGGPLGGGLEPKELDKRGRIEIENASKLKSVTIFCD